eukprot:g1042.t1
MRVSHLAFVGLIVALVGVERYRQSIHETDSKERRNAVLGRLRALHEKSQSLKSEARTLSSRITELTHSVAHLVESSEALRKERNKAMRVFKDNSRKAREGEQQAHTMLERARSQIALSRNQLDEAHATRVKVENELVAKQKPEDADAPKNKARVNTIAQTAKKASLERPQSMDADAHALASPARQTATAPESSENQEQTSSSGNHANRVCDKSDISFFGLLKCNNHGKIGLNCDTEFQIALEYLPSPTKYLEWWKHQKHTSCDQAFSIAIQQRLRQTYKFEQEWAFDGPKPSNGAGITGTHSTVGKSMLYPPGQFFWQFFTGRGFGMPHITHKDEEFLWTSGLKQCGSSTGWSCLFNDVRMPLKKKDLALLNSVEVSKGIVDEFFDAVAGGKLAAKFGDSAAAMFIAGQIYQLYLQPSDVVYSFVSKYLTRISAAASANHAQHPSVSMHVRHGDACHTRRKKKNKRETTEGGWYGLGGRPCYEPEVYMTELKRLKKMYGVQRVYLATDSQLMLSEVHKNTEFDWVFLNASREALAVESGGNFLENRLPGLKRDENTVFNKAKGDIFTDYERYLASVGAAADVLLMQQGDIFVGTSGSVFSRIGYYSMVGSKGAIVPWSTVDGIPFCCNGISSCAIEEMHKKDRTVTVGSCLARP